MSDQKMFKYVYIPTTFGEPMKVLEAPKPAGLESDKFVQKLKTHFSSRGKMDRKILKDQIKSKLKEGQQVEDKYVDMLMNNTSVEIVPLSLPIKENKYVCISMYVDDQGIAKNLPRNERATRIAFAAGRPSEVRGDAFLGRVYDQQDGDQDWARLDFTLDDCRSDAKWVTDAKSASKKPQHGSTSAGLQKLLAQQMATNKQTETKKLPEGSSANYKWTQTEDEVEITTLLPPGTTTKDLKVNMKSKTLKVVVDKKVILEGNLFETIRVDGSTWSFAKGDLNLSIVLEKAKEITWSSLLKS
mmetsp:Transcript_20947/g.31244  ORF Transcript_20947/g.31244 Transcript_20947/m.31244 type:complete len:300 (-) Transcript_20947:218-1117(-)